MQYCRIGFQLASIGILTMKHESTAEMLEIEPEEEEENYELRRLVGQTDGSSTKLPRKTTGRQLGLRCVFLCLAVVTIGAISKYPKSSGGEQETTRKSSSAVRPLSALAMQQAANYRKGTGLILNVHVTHHGGTTFCDVIGKTSSGGNTPEFACMGIRKVNVTDDYPKHNPWEAEETSRNIAIVRKYFHMISWEYGKQNIDPPLKNTDWEDPNLFSVYITRDPMSRLLAGSGHTYDAFPGLLEGKGNISQLWGYTQDKQTNNYALRILAGDGCCHGNKTEARHVESAKDVARRFSVVIDINCLGESMALLAKDVWNITLSPMKPRTKTNKSSIREILWDDAVYNYMVERNKRDTEFYEWTKTQAYLDCSRLPRNESGRSA